MKNILRSSLVALASGLGLCSGANASPLVIGNVIHWTQPGWFQVQVQGTWESICEGGTQCKVPNGVYTIINHDTGQRFPDVIVPSARSSVLAARNRQPANLQRTASSPKNSNQQLNSVRAAPSADNEGAQRPELVSPKPGSTLSGSSITFNWRDAGVDPEQWYLRVGSESRLKEFADQHITDPNTLSYTVSGLPTDGREVFVQFSYKKSDGNWIKQYYRYFAASSNTGSANTASSDPVQRSTSNAPAEHGQWQMTVEPPKLHNPLIYSLSNNSRKKSLEDYSSMGCSGRYIRINIPDNRDAVIKMDAQSEAIGYPVWIVGGRHIHVIGLEMRPFTQASCGVGEGHQRRVSHPNVHPRVPGHMMLRTQNNGVSFIEGVDIDLLGHEADCFVVRNTDDITFRQAKERRKVYIVNSRCTGFESLDDEPIGDGVHGDIIQNQGEPLGVLVFENTTFRSSGNGITHHAWKGVRLREFRLRNFDFATDWRYTGDDAYDGRSGLAFTVFADNAEFDNVWINEHRGLNYGMVNKRRVGAEGKKNFIEKHPGIHFGHPPVSEFAPGHTVGIEYVSPYNNPY